MRDNELILEILHQIEKSAQKVVQRFQAFSKPKDFTDTPAGVEKRIKTSDFSSLKKKRNPSFDPLRLNT
jgi:hypothetical protein